MYTRHIQSRIKDSLEDSPAILVNGARQTGKSTLVQQLLKKTHAYYTLDDQSILDIVNKDALGFLTSNSKHMIIDEIQKAPSLMVAIKQIIDRERVPGKFVLTGSSNILSLPKLSESLAGRMDIHTLWPLAQAELHNADGSFIDKALKGDNTIWVDANFSFEELVECIVMGGYPDVLKRPTPARRDTWCASYLQTLLQRDARDMAQIERLTELPALMNLLAARVGSLMNISELSRSIGLPATTLRRYLTLLENLYLHISLPPWSGNLSKRVTKAPKIYLNDTGLLCYLLGLRQKSLLSNRPLLGQIVENFVVMELMKQRTWAEMKTHMYHYRTHTGEEIDIVLEAFNGDLIAIEVKASQTLDAKSFSHIKRLQQDYSTKKIRGFVLYMGQKVIPVGKDLVAIPIANLWHC